MSNKTETNNNNNNNNNNKIPIEIISEEEMRVIETAISLASSSGLSLKSSHPNPLLTHLTKRTLPTLSGSGQISDIEDSHYINKIKSKSTPIPYLTRFRNNKGLFVTDITSTEWCEKQMEFVLNFGKPDITDAMRAGITRHAKLEEEVIRKVEVRVETMEDIWALKFMNFIICANQLLFEGLTRELPVVGVIKDVWMVGVIDELRMPVTGEEDRVLTIVDTKTRMQPRLPTEPQCRNGRLQLMCYKYLWDNLVAGNFPSKQFYEYFCLDSQHILSNEIKRSTADSGFPAETLGEVVVYFNNACSMLPSAHDLLLLRYEHQKDNSLIGEDKFMYNDEWVKSQIQSCLEFWEGVREAKYVPETERWKCRYCQFSSVCPSQLEPVSPTSSHNNTT